MDWPNLFAMAGSLIAILSFNLLVLDRLIKGAVRSLEQRDDNIEKLLNARLEPIEKHLSNHVTETRAKIDKLSGEVSDLKAGQARLESLIKELLRDRK